MKNRVWIILAIGLIGVATWVLVEHGTGGNASSLSDAEPGRGAGPLRSTVDTDSDHASEGEDHDAEIAPTDPNLLQSVDASLLSDNIHEQRTMALLAAMRGESMAQSIQRLRDEKDYAYPGAYSIKKSAQMETEQVLSNRRFLKVRTELQAMPRERAMALCRNMFDEALSVQRQTLDAIIASYEDPSAPKNEVSMLGTKLGMCSAILLASEYIGASQVAAQIEQARSTVERTLAHIREDPERYPDALPLAIERMAGLQRQFELNALLRSATYDASISDTSLDAFTRGLEDVEAKSVEIVAWDAQVTSYDFVHVHQGKPIDTSRGSEHWPLYDWSSGAVSDAKRQQAVLDRVRRDLLGGSK
jgi:hypothetical protein